MREDTGRILNVALHVDGFHVSFTPPGPRLLYLLTLMCNFSSLVCCRAFFLLFGLFLLFTSFVCFYEIQHYGFDFPLSRKTTNTKPYRFAVMIFAIAPESP